MDVHRLGVVTRAVEPGHAHGLPAALRFTDEWTVDGAELRDVIEPVDAETAVVSGDSPLRPALPGWAIATLRSLLGDIPGEYDGRTIPIYACPIDADRECGSITVRVDPGRDTVTWNDLGWDEAAEGTLLLSPRTLSFERTPYEALLHGLLAKYRELARATPSFGSWLPGPDLEAKRWRPWHRLGTSPLIGRHDGSRHVYAEVFPSSDGRWQACLLYPACEGFSILVDEAERLPSAVAEASRETWGVPLEPVLLGPDRP